jgi:hypothetical protein
MFHLWISDYPLTRSGIENVPSHDLSMADFLFVVTVRSPLRWRKYGKKEIIYILNYRTGIFGLMAHPT